MTSEIFENQIGYYWYFTIFKMFYQSRAHNIFKTFDNTHNKETGR